MYRFTMFLLPCFVLAGTLDGQWQILNEGIQGSLNASDFVNENVGWIAGEEGVMLKTEDGGQNWRSLPQVGNWNIRLIDFINDSIGWAAADDWTIDKAVIFKTTDGGHSWQIQKEIPEMTNNWGKSIFVVDDTTVYVVVTNANILKTSDGGVSWVNISPNTQNRYFNSVCFVNSDTGFVAGSCSDVSGNSSALILKTENGGKSWTEKINPNLQSIVDLQFIDDSTGFFSSWSNLYKTDDAFETWPATPLIASLSVSSYQVLNQDTIYAVVSEGGVGYWGCGLTLKKSTNGGITWENKFFINWGVSKVYFSNSQMGFLIGGYPYGGSIFRSIDSGNNWESQLLSYPFRDVYLIDKDLGFACGGLDMCHFTNGNILVTYDGGKSWEVTLSASNVQTCLFVNDRIGFASISVVNFGASVFSILKTEDAGKSWLDSYPFCSSDFFFVNEKTGWVAGRYLENDYQPGAGIIMTRDQGENWELVWKYPDQNEIQLTLNSLYFTNNSTGWAVGDNGLLVKCTDSLQWEKMTKITYLPLNKVFFADENKGFIAGGYLNDEDNQAILFKTTNGGATWEKIPNFPYLICDIYFHDNQHGWAVGTDKSRSGVIVATEDGGEHWTVQRDNLIGPLHALSYRENFLWAVGEYGLVLRTVVDRTIIIFEHESRVYPLTYKLAQNYPNPFNPATTIEFALPTSAFITLKVYNLLGEEVATLVAEKREAGIHRISWDARGLASGVYLYRVEAGEFIQTKKLILMR